MIRDMTIGNPIKLILAFSIPLLIGNVFQQLYNIADIIIVGRTIGVNALASVGAASPIFFFLLTLSNGLTGGLTVITAQKFGAKDESGVRRSVTVSILISLLATIVVTIFSILCLKPLLAVMNVPAVLIQGAYDYISIIIYGLISMMAYNLLSSIIRALGDSKTPLYFLIFSTLINIVLAILFICVFGMGIAGSAIAVIIAQAISSLCCIIYIMKKFPILQLKREDWKVDYAFALQHLRLALPMALQFSIIAIGIFIIQSVCNSFGPNTIAAFTSAIRIEQIATQPMLSFGIAMATYTAQNYGARKLDRIRQGVLSCSGISIAISLFMGFIIYNFGETLIAIFISNAGPEVLSIAKTYLMISSTCYFFLGQLFIFRNTLQGMGDARIPFIACIIELVLRCFSALYITNMFGFLGICYSNPISWAGAMLLVTISYFRKMKQMKQSPYWQPSLQPHHEI
ncbi:MATE family efflux transporter [Propionispira raffinosivorans]|uniref:MATE family efflux transporter n=1 Tax=Propionispira raffinosivorans TaxID=86959 RepID=UPI0003660D03|nr:MATE family efflux transporter [Propionispira raffinosivorans]